MAYPFSPDDPEEAHNGACINTDREIWREPVDDRPADSIFVTETGSIGMNCGGYVAVLPIRQWFDCMRAVYPKPDLEPR